MQNKNEYTTDDITVIIIAGGKGERLGGLNKGLLKLNNETFVFHLLKRISPQSKKQIISANNDISEYEQYNKTVIKDVNQNSADCQGPLAGIISCKNFIDTPLVLTIPCDSPMIPTDLTKRLLNTYNQFNTQHPSHISVAHDGKRLQNLFMLFHSSLLNDMESYFNDNQRKVYGWIDRHQHYIVDFSDKADSFINVNDEANLDTLISMIKREQIL